MKLYGHITVLIPPPTSILFRKQPEAPIVAETFITPQIFNDLVCEFDCEVLFYDGECVYANVIDNWLPNPPYFMDKCGNAPRYVWCTDLFS